jgi:hypothetical protein
VFTVVSVYFIIDSVRKLLDTPSYIRIHIYTHTYIHYVLSLGVKWPGREADHSPPSSDEVKEWVELHLHSPICLHGMVLKAQGQLYLI